MSQSRERTHKLIESFEAKALKKRNWGLRLADDLTSFFGSIWFLFLNLSLFIFWILANTGNLPSVPVFDPYPFVLLTTMVSLEAIALTTVVLMSQTRQSYINTLRAEMDMQVNLISEREITKALSLLSAILEEKGVKLKDQELRDMLKKLDTSYIERTLAEQLNERPPSLVQKVAEPLVRAGAEVERTLTPPEK